MTPVRPVTPCATGLPAQDVHMPVSTYSGQSLKSEKEVDVLGMDVTACVPPKLVSWNLIPNMMMVFGGRAFGR